MVELSELLRNHRVTELFKRRIECLKQGTIGPTSAENGPKSRRRSRSDSSCY